MKKFSFKLPFFSWLTYLSQNKYYAIALVIFLFGCFLSFTAFRYYQNEDMNRIRSDFNRLADIRLYVIQEVIEKTIQQLEFIKEFYYASSDVSSDDFHSFARHSLKLYPNLLGLGWSSHSNKESVSVDQQPYLDFISFEFESKNPVQRLFKLDYLELTNREKPLYFDIEAYPSFQNLFNRIANDSSIVLSNAVPFFQENLEQGFFLLNPVFLVPAPPLLEQRTRGRLRGVIVGFSDFKTILQGVGKQSPPSGINIGLYDNFKGQKELLYWCPSSFLDETQELNSTKNKQTQEQWSLSHTLDMGNHKWIIEATATKQFVSQRLKWRYWEVPIIGILISGLTAFYFWVLANRRNLIEREVQIRTEELAEINRILQQEIHERQRIEEDFTKTQRYLQKRHEALEYLTKFTTSELKGAIQEVILRTSSVMQIDRVSVWFYEFHQEQEILSCAGLYSFSTNSFSNHLEFSSAYFPYYFHTLKMHSPLIIPSSEDPLLNQELDSYLSTFHIISKLDIPIIFEGKLLGVLCCEETTRQRGWQLEDRHFGQTIADIISIMIEQSGRRKAEKALLESEERLRFITQKAIDAIMSVSDTGEIVSWNYGAEQMFGYSEKEIMGKSLNLILPHQDILKFESTKSMEVQGQHKDSHIFPVEISHTRWQSNLLYFDTIIMRDITERKEYEKRLIKAIREAQAANQAKSEFLTTISHELRTPLNAIIGFNQCVLMEMDGPINEQQELSLKKIEKSSFHLLSLINDILDLAKIEANKMELELAPQDIVELVQSCLEEIQPLAQQKQLEINLFTKRPYVLMEIDKIRIKQVLLNLLGNAVKFTEKGSIQVMLLNHPHTVEIQVIDTGIGLSTEEIAKIFKPFSQADSSITRRYGGTGLGLAISKKIIDLHGGTLEVQSQKGKGSSFIIILSKSQ